MNISPPNLGPNSDSIWESSVQSRFNAAICSVRDRFGPRNGWQGWVVEQLAWLMLRISHCQQSEQKLRDHASLRALDFWEEDQQLAVEMLAPKLARDPARTVAKLRQTLAGSDWLMEQWRSLAQLDPTTWTEDQVALARQLAGGKPEINPAASGFAAARFAELEANRAKVAEHDALVRRMVEDGLSDAHVPGLAQLRRDQRFFDRQMKCYTRELTSGSAPATEKDKTKPITSIPAPTNDKTKPIAPPIATKIDQTKPYQGPLPTEIDGEPLDWLAELREFNQDNSSFGPLPDFRVREVASHRKFTPSPKQQGGNQRRDRASG